MARRRYQNANRYNRKALGVQIDAMPLTIPARALELGSNSSEGISIKHISDQLPA